MDTPTPDDQRDKNGFPKGLPMTGHVQYIGSTPSQGFVWKITASVAAGLITMAIGFIGGAAWSHNTRITALETHRESDKENIGKLETRVDKLESRGGK